MAVVTIRGQLGSGAPEIGRLIADKLHTNYVDRAIIAEVAAQLPWPKQEVAGKEMPPGTLLGRIRQALEGGYGYGRDFEGVYLPTWEIQLDDTRYLLALKSVIKDLARSGSIVIRGRGSQFILKDLPGAVHILVVAPFELRVKRVMESMKLDEGDAKKEIRRFDGSRREFIKRYFHAELEDPLDYDLVMNTNHLNFENAASIIFNVVTFKDRTMREDSGSLVTFLP
jgi:cytidylate kinase